MKIIVREHVPYTEDILQSIIDTSLPILSFNDRTNGYEILSSFEFAAKLYKQSKDISNYNCFSISKTSSSNFNEVTATGIAWINAEKMRWECMFISFQTEEKEIMFVKKFLEAIFSYKILSAVTIVTDTPEGFAFDTGLDETNEELMFKKVNSMMLTNNINISITPFDVTREDIKRLISDNF